MAKKNIYKNTRHKNEKIWKYISCAFAWFMVVIFLAIVIFIIISAVPGFESYGLDGILGTLQFNLNNGEASIWSPLAMTLLVSLGSILIAAPIGIKTATFIKFRLKKKYQRTASILAQSLSGIPSVVFGLFAIQSLGPVISNIFQIESVYTVLNAIIMLTFMILPTIIALTLNAYEGVSSDLITGPVGLGMTRTKAIYLIYKRKARNGIIIAIIIALGRAIGETMALSMLLTSETFSILATGLGETLTSSLGTLGSIIATNMFSETGGEALRGVLYAFGIFLFIVIMLLNGAILYFTRKKTFKSKLFKQAAIYFDKVIRFIPNNLYITFSHFTYKSKDINNSKNNTNVSKFIKHRFKNNHFIHARSWYYITLETLSSIVTFGFLAWIALDILINGINTIAYHNSTIFDYTINTTGQAFVNTIIIIFVSLCIAVPISLFVAIFLNEYAKEGKSKKTILFFVDCLGSSPSIIFGMFGLVLFIETFGFTLGGTLGKSLLAGALTISIVILPTLIRTIQQALDGVPNIIRMNSYALGCGKWQTITKVIIPQSSKAIISSVIIATGRIIAETAPLYLTAGLSSSSSIGLLMPGQTLTTRIYAQLSSTDLNSFELVSYECAFVALILIIMLIWISNYLIPNYKVIKNDIVTYWFVFMNTFFNYQKINLKKYQAQIINKTLYLSHQQAINLNINRKQNKYLFENKKFYRIKYLNKEQLDLLKNASFISAMLL